MKLQGRTAVVTGAASGIGRATAQALAERGVRVFAADIDEKGLADFSGHPQIQAVPCDVADPSSVQALCHLAQSEAGGIDIWHNNAGIGVGKPAEDMSIEDYHRVLDINLRGVIHGVHAVLPGMLTSGRGIIVNTASVLGLVGTPYSAAYCASKFGVMGLSRSLDAELSPRGVRVLAICPGLVDTEIIQRGDVRVPGRDREQLLARWRQGVSPEVVARAVLRAIETERAVTLVPAHARAIRALNLLPAGLRHRLMHLFKV